MSIQQSNICNMNMEVEIDAPASKVWAALIDHIGEWWPAEFYAGGDAGARTFSIEPEPGGKMMESWDNGGGVLWGTVVAIDPGSNLQILGSTFPNWGGPTQWFGTWTLSDKGNRTVLAYSEHTVGKMSDSGSEEKEKGWMFLWHTLKAHVEGGSPPKWTD